MSQTTTAPAKGIPYHRAYSVAGLICDCRNIASTIADVMPDSVDEFTIDDLNRITALASAVARLMATAEDAADALASDLHSFHISITQGA